MPLSEHERQVLLFNLHTEMVPLEAKPGMTMVEVIAMLKKFLIQAMPICGLANTFLMRIKSQMARGLKREKMSY